MTQGKWKFVAGGSLIAGLVLAAGMAMAQDGLSEMDVGNKNAAQIDAANYQFVQPVCTRCHSPQRFLHYRSWPQWQGVFRNMIGNGAQGTPEQWDHIYKYFGQNLTIVEINQAFEDELSSSLGVSEKTAIDIVRRRYEQPFKSAEEVEAMPGVDKAAIERLGDRLLFDQKPKN